MGSRRASLLTQLVKNSTECRRSQFYSWVRKIHWRRDMLLTPVFWLENSRDYIAHGVAKSRTRLSDFLFRFGSKRYQFTLAFMEVSTGLSEV